MKILILSDSHDNFEKMKGEIFNAGGEHLNYSKLDILLELRFLQSSMVMCIWFGEITKERR